MSERIRRWQEEHGWTDEQMQAAWERFRQDWLIVLEADLDDEEALARFRETSTGKACLAALKRRRAREEREC